jgi:hypothetical protein
MSDDTTPQFDPRFSPAFQRGFDAETDVDDLGAPAPAPTPQRAAAPPRTANPPAQAAAPIAAPLPPSELSVPDTAFVEVEPDAPSARNPFLIVLGAVAIVLIAVGIWLFMRTGDAFNSGEIRSQGDYMTLDATIHMAPFIALLGAATAIGVLFVFASRWRKRR